MKQSSSAPANAPRRRTPGRGVAWEGTFARVSVTRKLLSESLERRLAILDAADMLTTDQGADLMGMTRAEIVDRIKRGAALGLVGPKRGYKLPRWQFEPLVWQSLARVSEALGSTEGWEVFSFLETPHGALAGATPRRALEQGRVEEALGLAAARSVA